jgi:hypothetical protein
VAGGAGGDRDQGGADRCGPGFRERQRGERAGGADQVEGHGCGDEPGGVRGEAAGREVGQGAVVPVGEDLLDDRVPRCWASAWTSSNGESVKSAW